MLEDLAPGLMHLLTQAPNLRYSTLYRRGTTSICRGNVLRAAVSIEARLVAHLMYYEGRIHSNCLKFSPIQELLVSLSGLLCYKVSKVMAAELAPYFT